MPKVNKKKSNKVSMDKKEMMMKKKEMMMKKMPKKMM